MGIQVTRTKREFVEPVFDIVNQLLRELSVHEFREVIELTVLRLLGVGLLRVGILILVGVLVVGPLAKIFLDSIGYQMLRLVALCTFNGALSRWVSRSSWSISITTQILMREHNAYLEILYVKVFLYSRKAERKEQL